MIKIANYIKDADDFIQIEQFHGKIPDPAYVDSAMELTVNNVPIITRAEWDYMIPLWAYIANGFEELAENPTQMIWTTGFPDQSIDLTFKINRKLKKIEIEINIPKSEMLNLPQETRKISTDLEEFITEMSRAGQKFFLRMAEIIPEESHLFVGDAERMQETAEKLINSTKFSASSK